MWRMLVTLEEWGREFGPWSVGAQYSETSRERKEAFLAVC
jgi:hypothetical protein